jgi:hypothetical protein
LGQHFQRPGDDFVRRVIASHGIYCDTHVYAVSSLPSFRVRLGLTYPQLLHAAWGNFAWLHFGQSV